MNDVHKKLIATLEKDDRLVVDGKLAKNKVIELALQLDSDLIKSLRSSKDLEKTFFQKVDDVLVFDKVKFQSFVSNKQFLPDSFTEYKNKIGLISDGQYLTESNEVVLAFPYKDCVLEGGQNQEDANREEIFWNETLAPDEIDKLLEPKVLTNFKKFDEKGVKTVNEISLQDNLIIKGNNLLSLYSLRNKYKQKVKLVYIDPPYNTGSDGDTFAYNNTFKHSTWLTFMKNRLEVAKDFITEDGFIAIAIDHAELFYLGALADEIFGRENRVGVVTVLHNPKGRNLSKFFSPNSEFMLVYAKNVEQAEFNQVAIDEAVKESFSESDDDGSFRYEPFLRARTVWSRQNKPNNWYPIYVSKDLKTITSEKESGYHEIFPITNNGKEMAWKNIKQSFDELNHDDYFIAKEENNKIVIYHKLREQQVYKNVWTDKKYQSEFNGTNLLKKILGGNLFSYPKSLYTVLDTLKIMTSDDDIVLDFFGGSGTTAHAVLALNDEDKGNRKFIICEQMDYIEKVTRERVYRVIKEAKKGSFVYAELAQANQLFVDKIQDTKNTKELLKVWDEMKKTAFLSYKVKPEEIDSSKKDFEALSFEDQQRFLISILDKNLLYVPYSEIDDKTYSISKEDKELNKKFYGDK